MSSSVRARRRDDHLAARDWNILVGVGQDSPIDLNRERRCNGTDIQHVAAAGERRKVLVDSVRSPIIVKDIRVRPGAAIECIVVRSADHPFDVAE